jgi:hypothetical protein
MGHVVGEYIDRLATIEMRPGKGNLPRGVMHQLYDAARARLDQPLVYRMAVALTRAVAPGDAVVILAGAGGPNILPHSEVDGIPGAAAIARSLISTLGARPVVVTEDRACKPIEAALNAAGLNARDATGPALIDAVTIVPSPISRPDCELHAETLFEEYAPTAVIAIEKLAPNQAGVIHNITGFSLDDNHTKSDAYIDQARLRGVLTCGIGDGGNEVGFGLIHAEASQFMPAGRVCNCPCAGGSTTVVSTDEFMVAAISDWGGYALGAMMAFLTDRAESMLGPDDVDRILRATIAAGARDGVTCRPTLSDDGVPLETQRAYASMLQSIVHIALSDLASPGH